MTDETQKKVTPAYREGWNNIFKKKPKPKEKGGD